MRSSVERLNDLEVSDPAQISCLIGRKRWLDRSAGMAKNGFANDASIGFFWHMNCIIRGMAKRANLSGRLQQVGYPMPNVKRQPPIPALYLMQQRIQAPKNFKPVRRLSVAVELNGDKDVAHPVTIVRIDMK